MRNRAAVSLRGSVAALLAILAALALAACGGGASSSTSTTAQGGPSTATATTAPAATTPAPATKTGSAKPSPVRGSAKSREARKAGHAAPFLVPKGDNSIPTYGSESSATQHSSATASLRTYLAARAGGSWSTACSQMASTVRKQLALLAGASKGGAKGCAGAYAMLSEHVPAAQRANPLTTGLAAFRVKGDKAFALFYGPHAQKYMMPMAREGGAWKVNQLAPIPYPLGAPTPPTG